MNQLISRLIVGATLTCAALGEPVPTIDANLKTWKVQYFSGYAGVYTLYKTEGEVSRLVITPYQNPSGAQYLSVLRIYSPSFEVQPRYAFLGDFSVELGTGLLTSDHGDKWRAVQFVCLQIKQEVQCLDVDGVLYRRFSVGNE